MRASLLCAFLAAPLFAAPPVPRPVSPADVRPAAYWQSTPNAATNGHGFVAVWDDQRMQERSSFTIGLAAYATALDENGHPRDPFGVQIGPSRSWRPFIASNGHGYLAAFTTNAGGWTVPLGDDAHPTRSPLNVAPREITGLASNGATYCALVTGYASSQALILDEQGNIASWLTINGWAGAIVGVQGRYIVFTLDGTRVMATTISAAGVQLDQRMLADTGSDQMIVTAYANGTRVLVTWYAQTPEKRTIDEVVLYAHGAPVDRVRRVFEAEGARYNQIYPPSLAWDGTSFLLMYSDDGLHAMRVDVDGDLLDDEPLPLSADAEEFHAVFDGTRTLLVSAERKSEAADPVARIVTSFAKLDELPPENVISFSPAPQADPDLAVAGNVALAVAREDESYGSITASLFSPAAAGNESHVVVAQPQGYTKQDGPSVAAAGDLFLVVWREASDYRTRILARRVALNGALLGPQIVIAEEPRTFANFGVTDVAFDGTNFLAAWHAQDDEIRVRGITRGGAFTGPALTVSRHDASEKRERRTPAVLWTGETYLVAWSEDLPLIGNVSDTNPLRNIYRAARVTRDGTLLDTNESLSLFSVDGYSHNIALAKGGDRVLFASATGGYLGSSQWFIHAQLFDLAGNPVGNVQRIDTATQAKRIHPAAAWNGKSFSVFWTEQVTEDETFLTGVRVLADGTLDERIDGGAARSFAAAAASIPDGVLVAETLIAPEQANVARIYARSFLNHPPKGRAVRP